MKFGVMACPNCRQAFGVSLSQKTTRCPRCGKQWKVKHLQIFYSTNSQRELSEAVGAMNEKLLQDKFGKKK